ncbi:hypothetical protein [Pseudonocardia sp. D17]|uniref:hypothetical protein n=1 Tax=Pseudonocardia sp. D17 TaxID=882661 RepID=UPI002B3EA3D6|nr:hypothetical protein PSD17_56480 [Pseudonocardia sp. D17]
MTPPTWHRGATAREHVRTIVRMYEALPDATEVALPLGVIRAALVGDWDRRDPDAAQVADEAPARVDGGLAAGTVARCGVCSTRITWVPFDEAGRHWNDGAAGRWVDAYGQGIANPAGLDSHHHAPVEAVTP